MAPIHYNITKWSPSKKTLSNGLEDGPGRIWEIDFFKFIITSKCPLGAIGSLGRTHFSLYKDGSKESGVDGDRPIQRSAQLSPMGVFWGASGNLLGSSWALLGSTLKPVAGRLGRRF